MIASFKTQKINFKIKIRLLGGAVLALLLFQTIEAQNQARPDFQWPLILGEFPALRGITSSFGESRTDHFHNGVDIAALGKPIRPAAAGEYVYSRLESDDPYLPATGPGNQVFLAHASDWISGYYHLDTLGEKRSGQVSKTGIIGHAGNTGHSVGPHLHFFFITGDGRYVNPMQHLPAVTDGNAPIIGQLMIKTPTSKTLVSHGRPENFRLSRYFPVLVKVIDPGLEKGSRRGIHRLKWMLNRNPEESRVFNELVFENDDWRLGQGGPVFDEVFGQNQYNLGELPFQAGRNTLVVTATDLAGNETTVTYDINVNKLF